MEVSQVEKVLATLFRQDSTGGRTSVLLMGPPGIGKTAVVRAAAKAAELPCLVLALPTCEAVDLRGLPYREGGQTRWASPFPRSGRGVLLLDELSSAERDVQAAAHHLVWSEEGSDSSLPAGWHVVLTANRASDKTAYRPLSGPMRNRLITIQVEASPESWCQWAQQHGVHPHVVGFIRWRPELLVAKEVPEDGAFPSPRTWEMVSGLLDLPFSADQESELVAGIVGRGACLEFMAYLKQARALPQLEELLRNPDKAPIPKGKDTLYALTTAMAYYTRQHQVSCMSFAKRLPAEFVQMYLNDIRDHFDCRSDRHIREWVAAHRELFDFR